MPPPTLAPHRARSTFAVAALAVLAGCAGAPEPRPPLDPPKLLLGVRNWSGTILTGRRPADVRRTPLDPAACLAVAFEMYYIDGPPALELQPVASRARLVVGARSGEPLLPVAELSYGALVGSGEVAAATLEQTRWLAVDNSRARQMAQFAGVLPVDTTLAIVARSPEKLVTDDGAVVHRRVSVLLSRDASDAISVALAVDDLAPLPAAADAEEGAEPEAFKRQIVLLEDAPGLDGDPLILEVPSRFDPAGTRSFAVAIELRSPPVDDPVHDSLVARCAAELDKEATDALARGAGVDSIELEHRAVEAGLRALENVEHRRSALVFLAGTKNAPLALDLALCADDPTVAAWLRTIDIVKVDMPAPRDVGWLIERSAYTLLAGRLDAGDLGTDLRGLLAHHAGEAGRFPGTLTALLARTSTAGEFEAAVIVENIDFLATSDPSARVRAFDWLAARDRAPREYDPLGPRASRRAAIAALLSREGESR